MIEPQLRVARRWQPGRVEDILQGVGDAVHRPEVLPPRQRGVGLARLGQRRLALDPDEGLDRAVEGIDARQGIAREGFGGELSGAQGAPHPGDRQIVGRRRAQGPPRAVARSMRSRRL